MGSNEAGEHKDAKLDQEEEVGSFVEDPETFSDLCGANQPISYIVHYANAMELYQKKTQNCFGCGSPNHLIRDCPKHVGKVAWKASLNAKEGTMKKGDWTPHTPSVAQPVSMDEAP